MPELKKEKTKHSNNICLCWLWLDYISQNSELHAKKGYIFFFFFCPYHMAYKMSTPTRDQTHASWSVSVDS